MDYTTALCSFLALWISGIDSNNPSQKNSYVDYLIGIPGQGYLLSCEIGSNRQKVNFNTIKMHFLMDSGSSNLVVAGSVRSGEQPWYDASQSITSYNTAKQMSISYTRGDVSGDLYEDIFGIPGLVDINDRNSRKKSQMNAFATHLLVVPTETPLLNSTRQPSIDGIIGFAYSQLSVQPPGGQPTIQSVMDQLVQQLDLSNQFITKFCGPTEAIARSQGQLKGQEKSAFNLLTQNITVTGTLTLGEAESNHQYQFQTVPVVEAAHFRIVLTDISIEGQSLIENCQDLNSGLTILDSGTPNIMLPSVVYRRFKEELLAHFEKNESPLSHSGSDLFRPGAKICQDIGDADAPFPGDVYAAFPTVELDVIAQTGLDPQILRLSLSAQQYLRYVGRSNVARANRDCFTLAVGESPNADLILGMSFLEGFEVLFNKQDQKVGFRTSNCVSYTQYPNLKNSRVVGVYQWNSAGDKSSSPEKCSPLLVSKENAASLNAMAIILIVFSIFVFVILCGVVAFFLRWRRKKLTRVDADVDGDKSEIEI